MIMRLNAATKKYVKTYKQAGINVVRRSNESDIISSTDIETLYGLLSSIFEKSNKYLPEEVVDAANLQLHNIASALARFNQAKSDKNPDRPTFKGLSGLNYAGMSEGKATLKNIIPNVTAKIVLTPHPTETFSPEAINNLKDIENLLFNASIDGLEFGDIAILLEKHIKTLGEKIAQIPEKMSLQQEAERSAYAAMNIYESIPDLVDKYIQASGLPTEQIDIKDFYNLVRAITWSKCDRDGKENVTVEEMESGAKYYREFAQGYYRKKLYELARNTIHEIDPKHASDKSTILKALGVGPEIPANFAEAINGIKGIPQTELLKAIADIDSYIISNLKMDELTAKLEDLRDRFNHISPPSLQKIKNDGYGITAIDELCIISANMGNRICTMQIRENRSKIEPAWKAIVKEFGEEFGLKDDIDEVDLLSLDRDAFKSKLINWLDLQDKSKGSIYQTLQAFRLAGDNRDIMPDYVIAECNGAQDVHLAQFLSGILSDTKPIEVIPLLEGAASIKNIRKSASTTTSLDSEMTKWLSAIVKDQSEIEEKEILTIDRTDPRNLVKRPLKVKDVLDSMGIKHAWFLDKFGKTADFLEIELKHSQTIMFAGSDSLKNCGPGVIPIVERAKEHAQLQGLANGVHVEIHGGEGNSVIRKEGGLEIQQTMQGSAQRREAGITQKIAGLIENILVWNARKRTSPGNMLPYRGSLKGFVGANNASMQPRETEEQWPEIRSRCDNAITAYQNHYEGEKATDFEALFKNGTPKGLKNYSARPDKRQGAEEQQTHELEHHKTRAIGYNLAMNAAGNCATFYLGMASFFSNDSSLEPADFKNLAEKILHRDNLSEALTVFSVSPKTQEMLVRMASGLVLADFKSAWMYLGGQYDPQTGRVSIDGVEHQSLFDLAKSARPEVRELARMNIEHTMLCPIVTAIIQDVQNQSRPSLENGLTGKLYRFAENKENDQAVFDSFFDKGLAQKKLLDALPSGLEAETRYQKDLADKTRAKLAAELTKTDKHTIEAETPILHAIMNTVAEIFEHAAEYFFDPFFTQKTTPLAAFTR